MSSLYSIVVKHNVRILLMIFQVRVVSMPSMELFDAQPVEYRRSIIPVGVYTVSVEALSVSGWAKYSHTQIGK